MRQGQDVWQFERAIDLAVRGEDLFDQSRPGARQADNKNRVGRRAAFVALRVDHFGRAEAFLDVKLILHLRRGIAGLLLFERVAELIIPERRRVITAILERLTEGKGDVNARHRCRC